MRLRHEQLRGGVTRHAQNSREDDEDDEVTRTKD